MPDKAIAWFRRTAQQHHGLAMYELGQMQLHGWGLPQDREEARNWFTKAAAGGSEAAAHALEELEYDRAGSGSVPPAAFKQT